MLIASSLFQGFHARLQPGASAGRNVQATAQLSHLQQLKKIVAGRFMKVSGLWDQGLFNKLN
jgi:hypothetical protein